MLTYLVKRIKAVKLSDFKSENVDEAVSTIKSVTSCLRQCSTDVRKNVPDDLSEIVLKIFQTSSVPKFNEVFALEESDARRNADKFSGTAAYPSVATICTLASNTYRRMSAPGDEYTWVAPDKQGSAFPSMTKDKKKAGKGKGLPRLCFNCGKENCKPLICKEPLDVDRIKRNSAERQRQIEAGGRAHAATDSQGRPLKKNKNGDLVVDQKAYKASLGNKGQPAAKLLKKTQKTLDKLTKKLEAFSAQLPTPDSDAVTVPAANPPKPGKVAATGASGAGDVDVPSFTANVHEIRDLIAAVTKKN